MYSLRLLLVLLLQCATFSLYAQIGNTCSTPINVTPCDGNVYTSNLSSFSNTTYLSGITLPGKDVFYKITPPALTGDSVELNVYLNGYYNGIPSINTLYMLWYMNSPCTNLPVITDSVVITGTAVNMDMIIKQVKLPVQQDYYLVIDFKVALNYTINSKYGYSLGSGINNCQIGLTPPKGEMKLDSTGCINLNNPLIVFPSQFGISTFMYNVQVLPNVGSINLVNDTLKITSIPSQGFALLSMSYLSSFPNPIYLIKLQNPQNIQFGPGDTHVLLLILLTNNSDGVEAIKGFRYRFQNLSNAQFVYPLNNSNGKYNTSGKWVQGYNNASNNNPILTWVFGGLNNKGDGNNDTSYACRNHSFAVKISNILPNSSFNVDYLEDGYGYDSLTCSTLPTLGCSSGSGFIFQNDNWMNLSIGSSANGGMPLGDAQPPYNTSGVCHEALYYTNTCYNYMYDMYSNYFYNDCSGNYPSALADQLIQNGVSIDETNIIVSSYTYDYLSNTIVEFIEIAYFVNTPIVYDFQYYFPNPNCNYPYNNNVKLLCDGEVVTMGFSGYVNSNLANFLGYTSVRYGIAMYNGTGYSLPDNPSIIYNSLGQMPFIGSNEYQVSTPGHYIAFVYISQYEFCILANYYIDKLIPDSISINYTPKCINQPVTIYPYLNLNYVSPSNCSISYKWLDSAMSVISTQQNLTITPTSTLTELYLQINLINGCQTTVPVQITAIPCVHITTSNINTTPICNTECIENLSITSVNESAVQWFFPGGTPSTYSGYSVPQVCYSLPGTYTIKVKAYNSQSADSIVTSIIVNDCSPTAAFIVPDTVCINDCVSIQNNSVAQNQCLWYVSNAAIDQNNLCQPTICFNDTGLATITLTAINQYGQNSLTKNVFVIGSEQISFSFTPLCVGENIIINIITPFINSISNINWYQNSNLVSTQLNPQITPQDTSLGLNVELITTQGCTFEENLTIYPIPCVNITSVQIDADTLCNSECITNIYLDAAYAVDVDWTFEGAIPTSYTGFTVPQVCYPTPGVYSIIAVAYNAVSSDTFSKIIVINNCLPIADFTTIDTACQTQCISPFNNSIDHNQCHWYVDGADLNESNLCNPTFCMLQTGTHDIVLVVQNAYGADTTTRQIVVVNCLPNAQFEPEEEIICLNDCIKMKSIPSDTSLMYWSFEKGTPSEYIGNNPPEICYPQPGTFIIKLLMENHWGKDSIVRYINVLYPVQLDLPDTIRLNAGENITLNVSGALTYDWTPVEYLHNASSNAPVLYPPYDMYYYVTAADAYECTTQDSVYVLVKDNVGLPSAFTPNGDGKNDVFRLINLNAMSEFSISIYNRYGQVIFASNNKDFAWDGTFKGRKVELGVYNYVVQYKLEGENRVRHFESAVTVLY